MLGESTRTSNLGIISDLTDEYAAAEVENVDNFGQLHQALVVSTTGTHLEVFPQAFSP